jgi:thioredoxin-related protein
MDAGTFIHPQVVSYLNKYFISVKVNGDDPSLGTYVKTYYGVRGYPTFLILRADGKLKGSIGGYMDGPEFATRVSEIAAN